MGRIQTFFFVFTLKDKMNYGFHTNKNDGKSQQINMQEANSSSCVNIDLHPQTSQ